MGQQESVTIDNAVINLTILEKNRRRWFKLNENVIMKWADLTHISMMVPMAQKQMIWARKLIANSIAGKNSIFE